MDVSRKKIAAEVEAEMEVVDVSAERKREIVERRLRSEINRGVPDHPVSVVTLMTTNVKPLHHRVHDLAKPQRAGES